MSKLPKKMRDKYCKAIGDHQKYISRITKTLYYGKFPKPEGLSLPVTELAAELFSEAQHGRSLDRLHCDDASNISRNACVSPCSLVLAILYLERLKKLSPEYLEKTASSDLFLVSLMVSCKFLYDDGEADEVFIDEWALSAGTSVKHLVQLEKEFLKAIDWEIFVNELTFWEKLKEIETTLAKRQGITRGFFTYTELHNLLTMIEVQNLIQNILAVSLILVASYAAALLTLFGSVLIVSHIPGTCIQPKKIEVEHNALIPVMCEPNQTQAGLTEIVVPETSKFKNDFIAKDGVKALNVLKTGIFLASIEGLLKPFCNATDKSDEKMSQNNVQNVSWDWWTIPTMKWLSETSDFIENFKIQKLDFPYFGNIYEIYINTKYLDLEDQIHKASKTRIQDQMENSWHKEWTDVIDYGAYDDNYLHNYIQNVHS
ncbi:protein CNPPD1 [Asbolus verrucosus]|uniref:Protein CNPPD1 n=1 Tax=Asbolus verrucosus TaxID=1661398 RepID=A0A482V7M9_ASBVE|nr:protein CNPPD1 [Asbolus verrucosus]